MKQSEVSKELSSLPWKWPGYLINSRVKTNGRIVSWINDCDPRLSEDVRVDNVGDLVRQGQYSFQIIDGSPLLLRYSFSEDGKELLSASLGYYRAYPSSISIEDVMLATEAGQQYSLAGHEDAAVGWLRLDYDPTQAKGPLHSKCHLHIGGLADSRLLVSSVPRPQQFVELVMAIAYASFYAKHRLTADQLTFADPDTISALNALPPFDLEKIHCSKIPHLRLQP